MSFSVSSSDPLLSRKRKMLLLLPVFIIPFLSLFFWAFGGGKGSGEEVVAQQGINTTIPTTTNAQILSKDEAYKMAIADSMKRQKEAAQQNYVYGDAAGGIGMNADPYATALSVPPGSTPAEAAVAGYGNYNSGGAAGRKLDGTINALQRDAYGNGSSSGGGSGGSGNGSDMESYLEEQKRFTQSMLGNDPVYQGLMKQSLGNASQDTANVKAVATKEIFTPVQAANNVHNPVSRLANSDTDSRRTRFFSGTAGGSGARAGVNTISGVIHQDQTIKEGAVVKIRLTSDINMAGLIVPKNSFVYAVANLGTERLNLSISAISYQNSIYPVKLLVYDMDGLPGIRIPGTVDQEARAQAAQQVINGSGSSAMGGGGVTVNSNPNFGSQIASQVSGSLLESGKQLLSRKAAIQKVYLKANYQIFLKQSASM